MNSRIFTARITWNGIDIEISYEPGWAPAASSGLDVAHLQVWSIAPDRAPLPFTETGYKSLFCCSADVAEAGGPVTVVREWLDAAAQSSEWKTQEEAARQYTMF